MQRHGQGPRRAKGLNRDSPSACSATPDPKCPSHLAFRSSRRALNSFDRAIAIDEKNSGYFAFRALAHAGLSDKESAESDFKMAVSLGFDAVVLREQLESLIERNPGPR